MGQETEPDEDEGKWVFLRGDRVYVLDSDDNLALLPVWVITDRQRERFLHLEESYRKTVV